MPAPSGSIAPSAQGGSDDGPHHRRRRLHRLTHRAGAAGSRARRGRARHARARRREAVLDAPLVVGDIADDALVERIVPRARRRHDRALRGLQERRRVDGAPSKYFRNNVDGTVHLLDAARGRRRATSCSRRRAPCTARRPRAGRRIAAIPPESVYAETKAMVERVLHWYGVTHGLRSVSLRYFNAAGASFDARSARTGPRPQPDPGRDQGGSLGDRQLTVFGATIPRPTARASATTSTSTISRRAHQGDRLPGDAAATRRSTSGRASVRPCSDVIGATERITGLPVPYEIVARRPGDPVATFADPGRAEANPSAGRPEGRSTTSSTAYEWHGRRPGARCDDLRGGPLAGSPLH